VARRIDARLTGYRWTDSVVAQGIRTLDDLAALSEDEVLSIPGIGPARLAEIVDVLWEHDLELVGDELDDQDEAAADFDVEPVRDTTPPPADGPVYRAVHTRVAGYATDPAEAPFAAIAERLAREVDDGGNPYVARELRMVLGVLGGLPEPANGPGDADSQPAEDEVAKARRERKEREQGA